MVRSARDMQVNEVPECYHQLLGHRAFTSIVTQGTHSPKAEMAVAGCRCSWHVITTLPSVLGLRHNMGRVQACMMVPLAPSGLLQGGIGRRFWEAWLGQQDFSWERNVQRHCGHREAGRALPRHLPFLDCLSNSPKLWS